MSQKPYERKCTNWLKTYQSWVMPRIAAPESYVFWAGIFCLSSAIRRKVFIGKSSLGTWECSPHSYIMLVGPPGFRKNTAMGPGIELLQELSEAQVVTKAPNFITKESLLDSIFKSPDSSVFLSVEEFGDLMLKSGPEMYEFLTSMFDGKKHVDQSTLSRSYEFASRPSINMLAGTTPKWISEKMPESVIGGGFASRVLFIYEDREPEDRIFFNGATEKFDLLKKNLVSDLVHIATSIEGEFSLDDETKAWFEKWNRESKKRRIQNPKLSGYYARKVTYIFKVAQLYHLSYSDSMEITREDLDTAIKLVESTERNLPRVFQGVGKNEFSLDSRDIVEYVKNNPGVYKDKLLREFETVAEASRLETLLAGFITMKYIRMEHDSDAKEFKLFPGDALK